MNDVNLNALGLGSQLGLATSINSNVYNNSSHYDNNDDYNVNQILIRPSNIGLISAYLHIPLISNDKINTDVVDVDDEEDFERPTILSVKHAVCPKESVQIWHTTKVEFDALSDMRICWRGRALPEGVLTSMDDVDAADVILKSRSSKIVNSSNLNNMKVLVDIAFLKTDEKFKKDLALPIVVKEFPSTGPGLIKRLYNVDVFANNGMKMASNTISNDRDLKAVLGFDGIKLLRKKKGATEPDMFQIFQYIAENKLSLAILPKDKKKKKKKKGSKSNDKRMAKSKTNMLTASSMNFKREDAVIDAVDEDGNIDMNKLNESSTSSTSAIDETDDQRKMSSIIPKGMPSFGGFFGKSKSKSKNNGDTLNESGESESDLISTKSTKSTKKKKKKNVNNDKDGDDTKKNRGFSLFGRRNKNNELDTLNNNNVDSGQSNSDTGSNTTKRKGRSMFSSSTHKKDKNDDSDNNIDNSKGKKKSFFGYSSGSDTDANPKKKKFGGGMFSKFTGFGKKDDDTSNKSDGSSKSSKNSKKKRTNKKGKEGNKWKDDDQSDDSDASNSSSSSSQSDDSFTKEEKKKKHLLDFFKYGRSKEEERENLRKAKKSNIASGGLRLPDVGPYTTTIWKQSHKMAGISFSSIVLLQSDNKGIYNNTDTYFNRQDGTTSIDIMKNEIY